MSRKTRSVPVAVAGVCAVLVIIVAVILVQRMSRHEPAPPGTERARTVVDTHEENRAPQAGTGETVTEAPAESTAAESEAPRQTAYSISGRVVDTEGHGVAEATVQAHLRGSTRTSTQPVTREVTTDETGAFQFDDLPRQDLFLTAFHGDRCFYLPQLMHESWRLPIPCLPGRDRVTGVRLMLRPAAAIAGHVVDADDRPLANAVVSCQGQGMPGMMGTATRTETDELGSFRIAGLVPGQYWLGAKADGFVPVPLVRAWAPTRGEDLLLRLERGVSVPGNVVFAESGMPAEGAEIRAVVTLNGLTWQVDTAAADAEGHFEILVHARASTTLTARCAGYVSDPSRVVKTDENAAGSITIELIKGGSVSGIVREKGTELPVAGIPLMIRSLSREWHPAHADTGPDGRFSADGVVPGRYSLWISSLEYAISEPSTTIEVAPGEKSAEVEVWVERKRAVTGTVVDTNDEPIAGAVVATCQKKDESLERLIGHIAVDTPLGLRAVTDADGRFLVRATRGDARITGLVASHPLFAYTFVELEEGEDSSRDIRIVLAKGGGSISGVVTDETADPEPQVQVNLLAIDAFKTNFRRPPELDRAFTDERGQYAFSAVPPGTYRVKASAYGRSFESDNVVVAAGQRIDGVDLTVPTRAHIAGTVTDADGAPVAGIQLRAFSVGAHHASYARTDAQGRYRLENLIHGMDYSVDVRVEDTGYKDPPSRRATCSEDGVDFVLTPTERSTIRGTVYYKADKSPVGQFRLRLRAIYSGGWSDSDWREFHNRDGSFECPNVPAGEYVIIIAAPGCVESGSKRFDLKANEVVTQVIYLETGVTVRGAVYRESDGSPVTEYHFGLRRKVVEPSRGRWVTKDTQHVVSDDGSFECKNVAPGTYMIIVVADGLPDHETKPFEVVGEDNAAQRIYIGDGAVIRGTVVDESGRPVRDAIVDESKSFAWRRQGAGIRVEDQDKPETPNRTTTDAAGKFVIHNLTPGTVSLRVEHPEYVEPKVRNIKVTEDAPTEDVVIELERGTVVYGWIKDVDGKAFGAWGLTFKGDGRSFRAGTDHAGQYRSPRLPRGTYSLSFVGRHAVLPKVTVTDEKEIELNIDFSEGGTVSGRLELPAQSADAVVIVRLRGLNELDGQRSEYLGDRREFKFRGLLPGTYQLSVSPRAENDWTKPPDAVTSPKQIIVDVRSKEDVRQDITVVKLKEPGE